jgi:glycosyltransferase involved in cell wall biosynthesis
VNIGGIFLNNELRTGGHTRYLELMEGLARRGNRVVVLLNSLLGYQPKAFHAILYPARYRRKSFPPASWIFRFAAGRCAKELRDRLKTADAVLVYGETHLGAGARLARTLNAPLVYGHRSNAVREMLTYLSEDGHPVWRRAAFRANLIKSVFEERKIARLADLIVFQSEYDREDFLSRVPWATGKDAVIRGDILGPRFLPEYEGANNSTSLNRIVFMGTLGLRKGIDYLIEAIMLLSDRGLTGLAFTICGPGDRLHELETRLRRANVPNEVRFHGRVPSPFPVISAADLLVVPSLFDSYPNTVLEALHVGTPVIGSRVGGIPDMLRFDELLFPAMDAEAIADRIERCVRDPAYYGRLRQLCSQRRVDFQFDWSEAWENAIGDLLAAKGSAGA